MAVHVVADSTCDLSPALIGQFGITILPLYVTLDGQTRCDGVDITAADIFRAVAGGSALPKTAAISVQDFTDCFTEQLAASPDDQVICITISAEFSSCYQNACIAAEAFGDRVAVVDSRNLSSGSGHSVIIAAQLAAEGKSAAEIADYLRTEIIPKVDASFIVDRLDFLHKGGRCTAVAALGANLLKLKPCIVVEDGKMKVVKKYRGNFANCVSLYVADRLADMGSVRTERIFITHAAADKTAVDAAEQSIRRCGQFDHIDETKAGCTVSSHCGPSTLGVLFIRK